MEVKQYITRMPFRIEYFQQKEVIVHHDRSVEETVYMEILKKIISFSRAITMYVPTSVVSRITGE